MVSNSELPGARSTMPDPKLMVPESVRAPEEAVAESSPATVPWKARSVPFTSVALAPVPVVFTVIAPVAFN